MKFSKEYSKLTNEAFTTIRKFRHGYYMCGMILNIKTPTKEFKAKIIKTYWINKSMISETLARSDADCSREELIAMLEKWYGKGFDDFVLITLERID